MTRFAFGAKCGARTASGFDALSGRALQRRRPQRLHGNRAKAELADVRRKWRRV